ncbi:hypothetical protein CTAYLR_007327 [Chrysophaeum taylorii]|uniref:leucine--tRNA ligase n=1 Tax=Chrysophaeum taylorii TaxID=2483200 RepID=A0AAD7UII5_9STRA|nr:hypothetical protein CTAYLR_007327 [Chrysophaeum taylorii]
MASWACDESPGASRFGVKKTRKFGVLCQKDEEEEAITPSTPATATPSTPSVAGSSFKRRDRMIEIEREVQAAWESSGAFEADAEEGGRPKFFVTFPYPYMNGRLHLGHAFSLTKAEFAAGFKRLQGYNVLFPFGFHCTGMPIQAAANKLKAELEAFGNPPVFPESSVRSKEEEEEASSESIEKQVAAMAKKGKAKKSKVAAKASKTEYQWRTMEAMGLESDEIAAFADPNEWLRYFPPLGVTDLKAFGASIDWRRSFITTDVNKYYDSFVRWQFGKLKAADKISYGKRANVYSVRDGQVCADHDRAKGEGVGPQEYVLIKLRVVEPWPEVLESVRGREVYLVPATLRPETMYGQTNCYVLPEGEYGAFEQADGSVFVCSKRAALGLAHQGSTNQHDGGFVPYAAASMGVVKSVVPGTIKGRDLLGAAVRAPLSIYDAVYVLPLTTISMSKGTGVVTSVPSDAPDDWIALHELKEQPELRDKYGLSEDTVAKFDVVPVLRIETEEWVSDVSAAYWCEKLEITSSKDADKLKKAKDITYLHGFSKGVMLVGKYAGTKVSEAKVLVRNDLLASGDAVLYLEPEELVVSRSGDECIVAHTDQWYLKYGETKWRESVEAHVDSTLRTYNSENHARFKYTLGWMREWACSRLFGLGTRIPWDPTWVIESLSDSTIYMAYYAVAHLLQRNLDGTEEGSLLPSSVVLTDQFWDYVLLDGPPPPLPPEEKRENLLLILEKTRREFRYWYPLDLRVSGKDLIGNHLTMCLYNHAAIWPERPDLWPRSFYCNGFVLLDQEKMSKSTGNFLLLEEACRLFSTDGVRFALADAGDTLEDANFSKKRADAAVVALYVEEEFARKVCSGELELRTDDFNFMDRAFENEIKVLANLTTSHFEAMRWRDGLISASFSMQIARDAYRDWCYRTRVAMRADLALFYVELAAILIAPICPHFSEHVWGRVLPDSRKKFGGRGEGTLRSKVWPEIFDVDLSVSRAFNFFRKAARALRLEVIKDAKNKPVNAAYIYVASDYPDWKKKTLKFVREKWTRDKKELLAALKTSSISGGGGGSKQQQKNMMQFAAFMHDYAMEVGMEALDETLPFDQVEVLADSRAYLQNSLNPSGGKIDTLEIFDLSKNPDAPGPAKKKAHASPGNPSIYVVLAV